MTTRQWELELGITWDADGRPTSPQRDLAELEPTWARAASGCDDPRTTTLIPSPAAYAAQATFTTTMQRTLALAAKGGPKLPRPWSPPKPFALTPEQRAWAKLYAGIRRGKAS